MPKRNAVAGTWQLQDAKARFSEVFRLAREKGPQRITRHGREAVVVLPQEEYERLNASEPEPMNMLEFFQRSPLKGSGLVFKRDRNPGRTIDL